MQPRDVYENLMKYPYCSPLNRTLGEYDKHDDTFFVKAASSFGTNGFGGVSGEPAKPSGTLLKVRRGAGKPGPQPDIEMYISRLLTGSCKQY